MNNHEKIRVTIWNEFYHEQHKESIRKVYPDGIHYEKIAKALAAKLEAAGKAVELSDATTLYVSREEIIAYNQPYVTDDPGFGKVNKSGKPLKMHLEHGRNMEKTRRASWVKDNLLSTPKVIKWTPEYYIDQYKSPPLCPTMWSVSTSRRWVSCLPMASSCTCAP